MYYRGLCLKCLHSCGKSTFRLSSPRSRPRVSPGPLTPIWSGRPVLLRLHSSVPDAQEFHEFESSPNNKERKRDSRGEDAQLDVPPRSSVNSVSLPRERKLPSSTDKSLPPLRELDEPEAGGPISKHPDTISNKPQWRKQFSGTASLATRYGLTYWHNFTPDSDEFEDVEDDRFHKLPDSRRKQPDQEYNPEMIIQWTEWRNLFRALHSGSDGGRAARTAFHDTLSPWRQEVSRIIAQGQLMHTTPSSKEDLQQDLSQRGPAVLRLLIAALTMSVGSTLELLRLIDIPHRKLRITMDCLVYLKRSRQQELESSPALLQEFERAVRRTCDAWKLKSRDMPVYRMRVQHLVLLLQYMTTAEVDILVYMSRETMAPLPHIVLALVDFYTQHGNTEAALKQLGNLPEHLLAASEPRVLQRCTNLLMLDSVERVGDSQNFKILPRLLELGISPNAILHTVMIQNAFAAGTTNVGWDIYRYLQAEKLEISPQVYLALLRDSFKRRDVRALNEVLTAIHESEVLARNPWIVNHTMNIVRIICTYERKDRPHVALSHAMAVYDRAFNRNQPARLGMVRHGSLSQAASTLPDPDPVSLGYVIRNFVLASKFDRFVNDLWDRLAKLIDEGDPTVLEAARHPVFYDGFVMFYSRPHHKTLDKALDILQHMLDHNLCQPTERTWTMLIYGFLSHGQEDAAWQIRDVMMEKGIFLSARGWESIFNRFPDSDISIQAKKYLALEERRIDLDGPEVKREPQQDPPNDTAEKHQVVGINNQTLPAQVFEAMVDLRTKEIITFAV